MLKIVARRPGGPGLLRLMEVPPPRCGPGEVVIAVRAAGVNFADCVARMGLYRSAWEMAGWPLTPGFEVAGHIAAHAADVTELPQGLPVIALTRFGGYAEQVAVPASQVFAISPLLSMEEAAATPVSFLTALHALALAAPPPGSGVLIHSAAGAAGLALIRVATSQGLRVIGVVGGEAKRETALEAGAEAVIVRARGWPGEARALAPRGYAAVFDAGGDTLRASAALVAPMGRLIAYGSHGIVSRRGGLLSLPLTALRYLRMPRFGALELANNNRSVMGFNLSYLFDQQALIAAMMAELIEGMASGRFPPPPIMTLPLRDAAEAHRKLQSGRTTGKLVLVCGGGSNSLITPQ
ncbi:medium chain dehydrogenase/reductase family protein [soil metagenome]